jgi:hypothetical protein
MAETYKVRLIELSISSKHSAVMASEFWGKRATALRFVQRRVPVKFSLASLNSRMNGLFGRVADASHCLCSPPNFDSRNCTNL